jgi:hypothetical protein
MFSTFIDGAANVFCDNISVVINATMPTLPLKKKNNAIVYHRRGDCSRHYRAGNGKK